MGLDRCLPALNRNLQGVAFWTPMRSPGRPASMVLEPRVMEHDAAGAFPQRQRPRRDDAC